MTDRRKFLTTMPIAAAGAVAAGSAAAKAPQIRTEIDTRQRDAFPAVTVYSHLGETLRFYDDLILNKVVMVNFMSIKDEESFPVTKFIAQVADRLGDKLGRDVFINSISTDPEHDTPKKLLSFAKQHGMRDGWRFLTSSKEETVALSTRLYRHPPHSSGAAKKVDIVFYGNGAAGVWGTFPVDIDPADAAERMSWVMPRERVAGLRQAGPRKTDAAAESKSHNREI